MLDWLIFLYSYYFNFSLAAFIPTSSDASSKQSLEYGDVIRQDGSSGSSISTKVGFGITPGALNLFELSWLSLASSFPSFASSLASSFASSLDSSFASSFSDFASSIFSKPSFAYLDSSAGSLTFPWASSTAFSLCFESSSSFLSPSAGFSSFLAPWTCSFVSFYSSTTFLSNLASFSVNFLRFFSYSSSFSGHDVLMNSSASYLIDSRTWSKLDPSTYTSWR